MALILFELRSIDLLKDREYIIFHRTLLALLEKLKDESFKIFYSDELYTRTITVPIMLMVRKLKGCLALSISRIFQLGQKL